MSATVDNLIKDTNTLQTTIGDLLTDAQNLDTALVHLDTALNVPSKIDSDLKQLIKTMKTAKDVLQVVKLVPEISTEVGVAIDAINAIEEPIQDAEKALADFDDKIEPIKQKIEAFDKKLKELIQKIKAFKTKITDYITQINNAQQCINSLPDGSTKTSLQSDLDGLASKSDQYVTELNTLLQNVINQVNEIEDYVKNKLGPNIKILNDIEQEIETLEDQLKAIIDPLSRLGALLNKKISVSFPYPCGTWSDPLKICHYPIGFTIQEILNGAQWIENEIKKILGKVLYEAAKIFGLGNLYKELEKKANAFLNKVLGELKKLFKSLNIQIPGLDKIEQTLKNILNELQNLENKFSLDLSPIEKYIQKIEDDIAAFKSIYDNCKNVG